MSYEIDLVKRMALLQAEGAYYLRGYEYAGIVLHPADVKKYIDLALELRTEDRLPVDFRYRPVFKCGDVIRGEECEEGVPLLVVRRKVKP